MRYVVETEGLCKYYGDVKAVDGVNLKVPRGTVFGIFGHNGAGKTTLISILAGLVLPTKGKAQVLGYDVIRESLEIRKRIGLLPEGFGFYEDLSALDNLIYLAELDGMDKETAKKRALEVLEIVGLKNHAEDKVSTFSRGMKQRLGIAQAILKDPDLIILDEPTVGIDPYGAMKIRQLIVTIAKGGKTVIISTHLLYEIGQICTHAAIMRMGKVIMEGSLEELINAIRDTYGYRYEIEVFDDKAVNLIKKNVDNIKGINRVDIRGLKMIIYSQHNISREISRLLKDIEVEVKTFKEITPSWEEIYAILYEKTGGEVSV
ncbi:MAG: ABC transporter ATP-binding protein [Thermoprotei archaeon]|nr:MAG: ABC transporter ATP-binding protein [Thermoprotei archaeon]